MRYKLKKIKLLHYKAAYMQQPHVERLAIEQSGKYKRDPRKEILYPLIDLIAFYDRLLMT